MKNIIVAVILALLSLNISCASDDQILSYPSRDMIKGSGKYVSKVRKHSDFHSVHISSAGIVNVLQGNEHKVIVTADDNIIQFITTGVSNEKLFIGIEHDVQIRDFEITVDVTMTDIEELSTSSAGSIFGENKFEADFIRLVTSSAGNINVEMEAEHLHSTLSSAGNIYLRGSVEKHDATLSSAGNLNAFGLTTNESTVILKSVGNAAVFVSELLDATVNSVGSLYYKGNPEIRQKVTSIGRIYSMN